ncbi:MAG: ribosome maturation factor RimP [Methylobacter sp.]|nr:ribosome maturation factor RimP [Methylococcales bacterium]MDD5113524.1 ribosome maturation factor RimP [Methylobacter sp.]
MGFFIFWTSGWCPKNKLMEEPLALFLCAKFNEVAMKQAPEHLSALIEPIVEGLGYECVGIDYNPHPKHGLLRIYIDSEKGILVEDCTKVSHQISGVLDVEDPIPGNYQLEVSSPGEDRPFFKVSQFERFIGNTVLVNLFKTIDGRRKITGVIKQVDGDVITLQDGEQIFEVAFAAMSKARLVPEYLIEKGGRSGK